MQRSWQSAGALLAGLAVLLGAFGAHGLRDHLTPERLAVYEVAVRYQMYHALGILLAVALLRQPGRAAGWFAAGIALFSGSLYALAASGVGPLGAITPCGGVCFVVGWWRLASSARRSD
ncbi:MAG: DUF423 domain-containing protein [Fimbriimonadaceae bacterium]|nr:DUF423 domain-containing protein [Fimbriimonadaceae bacterium]